ncbi:MAG: hypothetical protein M1830_007866, partial [Pleopsidium flavum]
MAFHPLPQWLARAITKPRPSMRASCPSRLATPPRRTIHYSRIPVITSSSARLRPRLQQLPQSKVFSQPAAVGSRTIFIQTENTPNAD